MNIMTPLYANQMYAPTLFSINWALLSYRNVNYHFIAKIK